MARLIAVLLGVALAAGCSRPAAPASRGRRLVEGEVLALRASPDGAQLAYLHGCRKLPDRSLPPGTAACALAVVPAQGGAAVEVASGVTTLPPGFGWSAEGHALAALGDYDHPRGRGALWIWSGGAPRRLAEGVTFYALARDGSRVGWAAQGQLFVAGIDGPPQPVAGAAGVSSLEFGGREGAALLARRAAVAGGELLAVSGQAAAPVAAAVRDYAFARGGEHFAFTAGPAQALTLASPGAPRPSPALGRDVQSFLFSPGGDAIAFVADAAPGRQGDLWVAPLAGGAPRRLGQKVGEPRWSARGERLAWLEDYEPRGRTGRLTLGGLDQKPRPVARNVSDFDLAAGGGAVAFLQHVTAGGYSVDLGLLRPDRDAQPWTVARGVFGFSFSPDGRWLYYRTACVREGEACDLYRVEVGAPAPAGAADGGTAPAKGELVAEGVKSFEFAPGRPDRLLVAWARKDRVALDLAVWEAGKLTAVDTYALPGSVQFLGSDARRLGYAVVDPKRPGVYVAELP
ncbi:TolB family protein [Anaeromyxobacter diazotrophicus]|uniref:Uncharacterized protein n=1 Tax=Anaeromyxobacter diazotrophicus TaxID=2590199 RepID=A0A7I9VII2_9BACT|nr:PD40 domain-containing protein [Anaeromyxobacter diazotrophicus]GEJ56214.1 hypothetical protein AMYX_09550 [Anaeromyxobacter diazotrophicus]